MKIIKWTNKYSNESGYVGAIDMTEKHFVNAASMNDACTYKTDKDADKAIADLMEIGEGVNNNFEAVNSPIPEKKPVVKTEEKVVETVTAPVEKPVEKEPVKPVKAARTPRAKRTSKKK